MSTIAEVQYAIRRLSLEERQFIASWLEGYQDEEAQFVGVKEPALKYAEEPRYMTEEEYLEFEECSPTLHEYVNGYVHAMSPPSMAHGRIVARLHFALTTRLGDGPCEPFSLARNCMSTLFRIMSISHGAASCTESRRTRSHVKHGAASD